MKINSDLKREGIEVLSSIDKNTVTFIAKNIALKITDTFSEHDLEFNHLNTKLSKLNMFIARTPKGLSEANYFYKNSSIYFNEDIDFSNIETYAIHESIHCIQERKNSKGNLSVLGLCKFNTLKVKGLGVNEAAVQLATCKINKFNSENVKYYGISFNTISPNCYPLQCNLINQMAYITGEYTLFNSTFNSNDDFKNKFIELTSKKTFNIVEENFDTILYAEENIIKLNNLLESTDSKIDNIKNEIVKLKELIKITFFETQNLIINSYFNKYFSNIYSSEELENFRRKLYNFKDIIGSNDEYMFFNNYYIDMMDKLEKKCNLLENNSIEKRENSLTIIRQNKFFKFIRIIKKLLLKPIYKYEQN